MKETLTVEKAQEFLRAHHAMVEAFREEWWPHWACDCEGFESCGPCHCGLEGHLLLPCGPFPFDGVFCSRCANDLLVLAELLGDAAEFEACKEAAARQREDEKRKSDGKDLYFLEGEAYHAAVLKLCLKTLDEHEEELTELKKDWKPNCYCKEGERFCGKCSCGAKGHSQHFPGPLPLTSAWCDNCSLEIAYLVETLGTKYGVDVLEEAAKTRRKSPSKIPPLENP